VGLSYPALLVVPRRIRSLHRKVPGVVVGHGRGGNACSLFWAARLLAAHGYIALAPTYGPGATPHDGGAIAEDAMRSGVGFLRSASNPYRSHLRRNDLGLLGHSQGSIGASIVQGDTPPVRALVGLDNLRRYADLDPGGIDCATPADEVTPRVPGLGIGSETGCGDAPANTDKRAGYQFWHDAGIPTMEVVLAGMQHVSFGGGAPFDAAHTLGLRRTGYYLLNWFDRWLRGKPGSVNRLLSPTPLGDPIDDVLSSAGTAFTSAAFLPGRIDCDDLRSCL
jgi:hypothetical protein